MSFRPSWMMIPLMLLVTCWPAKEPPSSPTPSKTKMMFELAQPKLQLKRDRRIVPDLSLSATSSKTRVAPVHAVKAPEPVAEPASGPDVAFPLDVAQTPLDDRIDRMEQQLRAIQRAAEKRHHRAQVQGDHP